MNNSISTSADSSPSEAQPDRAGTSSRRLLGAYARGDRCRLRRYRHQPALRASRVACWRRSVRGAPASEAVVLGILSLIIWALFLVVTVKYVVLLLRADNNGEGGTLALMALANRAVGGSSILVLLGIDQRRPVLWRRDDHAGAVGALGRSKV